jgi:hypothetical protein
VAQLEKRNAHKIMMGKPERKRPLGRPRYRWINKVVLATGHGAPQVCDKLRIQHFLDNRFTNGGEVIS